MIVKVRMKEEEKEIAEEYARHIGMSLSEAMKRIYFWKDRRRIWYHSFGCCFECIWVKSYDLFVKRTNKGYRLKSN